MQTAEIEQNLCPQVHATIKTHTISRPLLVTLATVFAISPFAIDSYLPAMPAMAEYMGVNISLMSVTVSLYVFGLAVGQLIGGPLSDKKGRRFVMVLGLLIFAVCSTLLTSSSSIEILWIWRFLQAVGGGIAVVGVPAVIRDNSSGKESAKLFSLIALIMMVAPSVAPTVGTLILAMAGWQWIFYFLSSFAIIVIGLVLQFLPHTTISRKSAGADANGKPKKYGLLSVFKEKHALGFMLAQAFSYAVMMTFLTNASMIYMQVFGVTANHFSILFAINICGLVVINRLNSLLLRWFEPAALLKSFLLMQVGGGVILVTSQLIAPAQLYFAVTGFVVCVASGGGIIANSSACFLKSFAHNAGSASAVLGAVQYTTGAAVSAFAAFICMGRMQPVVMVMLVSSTIALLCAVIADKKNSRDE